MTAKSIVRPATPGDQVEVWRLFRQAHDENGLFKLAPQKVDYIILRCLFWQQIPQNDYGVRGIIGVIGEPGALEGLALVTISEYWYTSDKHLEEMLVYVDPSHRKSRHAVSLLKWMKEQSERTGLPLLTGVVSNVRTAAKCALYARTLPKVGEFYLHNSKPWANGGNSPPLAAKTRH